MNYEFKNLSDVDRLETLSDSTTIMGFDNGKPVQFSSNKVGSVKTVNGAAPDESGNINVGSVKTVNGAAPDENGNIALEMASSWNDLTDKPFSEESGLVEILPETTVTFSDGPYMLTTVLPLTIGNTYTVNWNGTEYSCVAWEDTSAEGIAGTVGLGNQVPLGGTDTGEPFAIGAIPGEGTVLMPAEELTSVTVSIVGEGSIIKTIDPKYLPGAIILKTGFDIYVYSYNSNQRITKEELKQMMFSGRAIYLTNGLDFYELAREIRLGHDYGTVVGEAFLTRYTAEYPD